ncbi:MAG: cupin domain-containing protein [Actinomycetota bacterium]|nr:cupin domain-containing protein [Actinomycetota bacterium]
MVPEAPFQDTGIGLRANGEGWFVVNARESPWREVDGRGAAMTFEGATDFPQVGVNLFVLGPGEPMAMYHWEADQEDYLVLSGEAMLIVEGQERQLRQWDFVHCPPQAAHVIVGAGEGCAVLAIGAREHQEGEGWGGYPVNEVALKHGAGVDEETTDADKAYARFPEGTVTAYRDGWLPGN